VSDILSENRLEVTLVESGEEAENYYEEWDELAVSTSAPYCAPAWMLAWWRHAAPADAQLRLLMFRRQRRLVGLAPLFARRTRLGLTEYRLLASGVAHGLQPLAAEGFVMPVATALAWTLAKALPRPDVVAFDGMPARSPWPRLLADDWPGRRPVVEQWSEVATPRIDDLPDDFDGWLAAKSKNFRRQARRTDARLREAGVSARAVTDPDELGAAIEHFARLHRGRWSSRGGSGVMRPSVERMLLDAGPRLIEHGRFRLWLLEEGDRPVAAKICLGAGTEMSAWLGGFDESRAAWSPSFQLYLSVIHDAIANGYRSLDLGVGDQPYKSRLADGESHTSYVQLLPAGRRQTQARLALRAHLARRSLAARVSPEAKRAVKRLVRRGVGAGPDAQP
jgi:CelD/BcsL family acetyltransferase involved in cellulose biosynthesis